MFRNHPHHILLSYLLFCSLNGAASAGVIARSGFETTENPPYPKAGELITYRDQGLPVRADNIHSTYLIRPAALNPFGTGQFLYVDGIDAESVHKDQQEGVLLGDTRVTVSGVTPLVTVSYDFLEPSGAGPVYNGDLLFGFGAGELNSSKAYICLKINNGKIRAATNCELSSHGGNQDSLPNLVPDTPYSIWHLMNRSGATEVFTGPGDLGEVVLQHGQMLMYAINQTNGNLIHLGIWKNTFGPAPTTFQFRTWSKGSNAFYLDNFTMYNQLQTEHDTAPVVWTGQGANELWTTAANWLDEAPPFAGDSLLFTGEDNNFMINDYPHGTSFNTLFFDTQADDFFVEGNSLSLTGGINVGDERWVTFATQLVFPITPVIHVNGSGLLSLGAELSGRGGIQKIGSGVMILEAPNRYKGASVIDDGFVDIMGNQSEADGGWSIGTTGTGEVTVTLVEDSILRTAAGRLVQVGNSSSSGTKRNLIIQGDAQNDGSLYLGHDGMLQVEDGGTWRQNGPMTIGGIGGYAGTLRINQGGVFTYAGESNIVMNAGTNDHGRGRLEINGGTLITNQGIEFVPTDTMEGAYLVFDAGRLVLSDDTGALDEGLMVLLEGEASIDTDVFSASFGTTLSGPGSLIKEGAGSLVFAQAPQHRGGTELREGLVQLNAPGLDDASSVSIGTGAVLDLNFTGVDVIASLVIAGQTLDPGVYGADDFPEFLTGTGQLQVTGQIEPGHGFADWAASHGLSGDPTADFDQDGLDDAMEYALAGLNPSKPDGFPGILAGETLSFQKNPDAVANGDVTYSLEWSGNLSDWFPVDAALVNEDDETISVSIPQDEELVRVFVRLRVAVMPLR